jgi:nickel-dependent lactate racemase
MPPINSTGMKVNLAYGQGLLPIEFPDGRTVVIAPSHTPGLPDEKAAVIRALEQPIASKPLRELIGAKTKVCILFTDITRATPNERIIPWLLEHLSHIPRENITLLNQLGTHRPNTKTELEKMLTPAVVANYRVVNHEPENDDALVQVGVMSDGVPALLNKQALAADLRIVTGFIEPHFFAGFSGGIKGIMPGVGGLRSVMSNHGFRNIGDPNATFGINEGNPLWEELRDIALKAGPSFVFNVTLNEERAITRVFAGDILQAHKAGTEFVRQSAMQAVEQPFDVVVATNSGYPLDMNLYQGVKGMSAGARIIKPGGTLILAAECSEGVPANSPLDKLLRAVSSPEDLLALLAQPGFVRAEQWQAQIQAIIQRKARVLVHSKIPDEVIRAAHLEPCHDIAAEVANCLCDNANARVAVLPQGPLTIPYLVGGAGELRKAA